ncbi:beta-ketoacyl synthase N-terminal-like domain-containing protein [Actinoplanes sp. GCM10030250]|uniref:beta-ketoacyl synthase N-terminal-like domain-containing protein n=1 Tax=Actinoplanes sp. GCM10030250 TaxID=3273376 RepID=UPI003621D72D
MPDTRLTSLRCPPLNMHGFGAVSAYGWGTKALIEGLAGGHHAATYGSHLGPGTVPFWMAPVPAPGEDNGEQTRYAEAVRYVADEAIESALESGWRPGPAVCVILTSARGDLEASSDLHLSESELSLRRRYVRALPSTLLSSVAQQYGFNGPSMFLSAACAGGVTALHVGRSLLMTGAATDVVVIGADIGVDHPSVHSLAALGPLQLDEPPDRVCRPFDASSKGFSIGEGAGALVMSPRPSQARTQLLATAAANDHYHATSLRPDASVAIAAASRAIQDAGLDRHDVSGYLAHGSGTPQCSRLESDVLRELPNLRRVSALKPLLGHCRSASPILEIAALSASAVEHLPPPGGLPSTLDQPDGAESGVQHWLHAAFGFGGNISFGVLRQTPAGDATPAAAETAAR